MCKVPEAERSGKYWRHGGTGDQKSPDLMEP